MGEVIDHSKSITNLFTTRRGCDQFKPILKNHLEKMDWLDVDSLQMLLGENKILIPVYMAAYEIEDGRTILYSFQC